MSVTEANPSVVAADSAAESGTQLASRRLGAAHLVFFIVAAAAPLAVVDGAISATYLVTGNLGVPFLYIPIGITLCVFAIGYAAMSQHVTDAGAFYSYVVRGLGRIPGVGVAFTALMSYNSLQIGIYGLFGVVMGAFAESKLHISMEWYVWCAIGWAVIATLGVLRIDVNARVLAILLCLEILVLAIYDLAIVAEPGPEGLSTIGFHPSSATTAALGATLVFGVASFVGFESAAIYGEEVRNPTKTIAKATFIAVGLIAVFYAVSSWLLAAAVGPETIINPDKLIAAGFGSPATGPDPTAILVGTGTDRLGQFWGDAVQLLLCTSVFAGMVSFHQAVARYTYTLGRQGVFPKVFSRTNRMGAPFVASAAQSVLAAVVVGYFAIGDKDPILQLFTWLSNLGAIGVLFMMTVTSAAVIAYFRRRPDPTLGQWRTFVAPLVAGVAMAVGLVLGVTNFNVLITGSTEAPRDSMSNVLLIMLFGSTVVGLVVAALFRRFVPERYARIGSSREESPEEVVSVL